MRWSPDFAGKAELFKISLVQHFKFAYITENLNCEE